MHFLLETGKLFDNVQGRSEGGKGVTIPRSAKSLWAGP